MHQNGRTPPDESEALLSPRETRARQPFPPERSGLARPASGCDLPEALEMRPSPEEADERHASTGEEACISRPSFRSFRFFELPT